MLKANKIDLVFFSVFSVIFEQVYNFHYGFEYVLVSTNFRRVFRTLQNIYDEAFFWK